MRVKAEQLTDHLDRNGLAPVYVISGEEPLQMIECADRVRSRARKEGIEERIVLNADRGFEWQQIVDELANISLFSARKLIELRMGKPGREGGAILADYAANPPADIVLLISCDRLDKRAQKSKWYSALDKCGVTVSIWPIDANSLPDWIRHRVTRQGKKISPEAATLLADRVEGNLLAAKQEIDKLCLLTEFAEIGTEAVLKSVSDSSRFNVFELMEAAMAGDVNRTDRILYGLRSEGLDPANIHAAVQWELRRLCNIAATMDRGIAIEKVFAEFRIWENRRKQAIKMVLKRHNRQTLYRLLRETVKIDRQVKSSERVLAWDSLEAALFELSGHSLFPPLASEA